MDHVKHQLLALLFRDIRRKLISNLRNSGFWREPTNKGLINIIIYKLKLFYYSKDSKPITLHWKRENSKNQIEIQNLLKAFPPNPKAKITNVFIFFFKLKKKKTNIIFKKKIKESEVLKYKPYPLNTIKLQKLASEHLNFPSDKTMKTAELLYNKGFISYPRTETNSFKPFTNFKKLVELQKDHETLSKYTNNLLSTRIYPPREGPKNDNSHPPIYPAKALNRNNFDLDNVNLITQEEIELYELIARCFLASCSKDASANEKIFDLELEKEAFYFKELKIKELNYLEIYPYEKWLETQILSEKFEVGQILENVKILMKEGKTYPPKLLKESELIDLMDKFEIGTDSTIHEHIKKIQEREYAIKIQNEFHPTALGYALIETYEQLGLEIAKPNLRSLMEKEMKSVADGVEEKEKVLGKNLGVYEEIYGKLADKKNNFGDIFVKVFNEKVGVLKGKEKQQQKKTFYKKKILKNIT